MSVLSGAFYRALDHYVEHRTGQEVRVDSLKFSRDLVPSEHEGFNEEAITIHFYEGTELVYQFDGDFLKLLYIILTEERQ